MATKTRSGKKGEARQDLVPESRGEVYRPEPGWLEPWDEMDRVFDRFFDRNWLRPFGRHFPHLPQVWEGRMPRVDVLDRDDAVVVRAELPGVNREDLDVSLTEDTVTIRGSSRRESKEEKEDYYRCEISRGEFARTVRLPAAVDGDKAKAKFSDGILELTLPKEKAARRRTIEITED